MPDTLVVTCPLEEKEMLMAAAPGIYFETDHYRGWPAVLVRIEEIDAGRTAPSAAQGMADAGAETAGRRNGCWPGE